MVIARGTKMTVSAANVIIAVLTPSYSIIGISKFQQYTYTPNGDVDYTIFSIVKNNSLTMLYNYTIF